MAWVRMAMLGFLGVSLLIGLGPAWGADREVPLHREGSGRLFIERTALENLIRQDLGVLPGQRIMIGNLPKHFQGPMGKDVSAVLSRQEGLQDGRCHYRLNILEGGIARETFYLHVRIPKSLVMAGTLSGSPHRFGEAKGRREEIETMVHAGDMVRVTVRGQGFQIRFPGISQGEGTEGERIPIVNPISGRSLTGEITGHDRVMVDLSGRPS